MKKKTPEEYFPRGQMHQRRTVGLDIPCQVARLQSLTPLLQAAPSIARTLDSVKASGLTRFNSGSARQEQAQHASPRKDAPVAR